MIKPSLTSLPCAAPVLLSVLVALPASAEVLLDDTFADGTRDNTALPTESNVWVSHSDGVTMSTGSLLFDQTVSSGSQKMWTHFAPDGSPVELAVGDQLIATIEFTPRTMLYDNSSNSFRVGLFNDPTDPQVLLDTNDDGGGEGDPWTDAEGYGVQLALSTGVSATDNANVGKRTDLANSSLMGSSGAWTFSSDGDDIVNTLDVLHTITLALTRTAEDQMEFAFTIADPDGVISTHTIVDDPNGSGEFGTDPIATTFDQLFFRFSNNTSTADALEFSRFRVEHVSMATTEDVGLEVVGFDDPTTLRLRIELPGTGSPYHLQSTPDFLTLTPVPGSTITESTDFLVEDVGPSLGQPALFFQLFEGEVPVVAP